MKTVGKFFEILKTHQVFKLMTCLSNIKKLFQFTSIIFFIEEMTLSKISSKESSQEYLRRG